MDPEPALLNFGILLLDSGGSSLLGTLLFPFLLFLLLLVLSFLASSSEVAFLNMDHAELDKLKEEDSASALRVTEMVTSAESREKLLATILIVNNFANVFAILVAVYILNAIGSHLEISKELLGLLNLILVTVVLLIFGEILPKIYANQRRTQLAKFVSIPLFRLRNLLSWPTKALIRATRGLRNWVEDQVKQETTSASDVRSAIDLTVDAEGQENDHRILRGIVNFSNTLVTSVMKARVDVVALDITSSLDEVMEVIKEHKYSRMPVYDENLDQIKGILHVKSLLPLLSMYHEGSFAGPLPWDELLAEAIFVPESQKIDLLLEDFKKRRIHQAIVVDEFGGTSGIVTLEDIIEEIVGDIWDESDLDKDLEYRPIGDHRYMLKGVIAINDMRKVIPELDDDAFEEIRGGSDTLGGLILEINGRIPKLGDTVVHENIEFFIESATERRIERVKMTIHMNDARALED